jgi:zinc/manganese transport system substrate-binding protein
MIRLAVLVIFAVFASATAALAAGAVSIVAAENFYGDVAQQIGGPEVEVTSILSNPDEDPHLFEVTPSAARAISHARLVIYNGIDYDPWMVKLLRSLRRSDRTVIDVAALSGRKRGDNPHIWYDPNTMMIVAKTLADDLGAVDPEHRSAYQQRLQRFRQSMTPLLARIAALRRRFAGTPVTATEPIFGYMFDALGMQVRNWSFQLAVMNNTEPSASDIAAFENDLKTHQVKLLIYNSQVSAPSAERMLKLAKASDVAVVGATETEPPGQTYQQWMIAELDAIDRALRK